MKRVDDRDKDRKDREDLDDDAKKGGQSGGIFDSVIGAVEGAQKTADAARDTSIAGSARDMMGGLSDVAETATKEAERQRTGDTGQSADAPPDRKWRGSQETGVSYDAQGRRVDQGAGGVSGSLVDALDELADAANQAADTVKEEGEWRSLSGTDDAIGSEAYNERMRQAHEAAGTEWYPSSAAADEKDKNKEGA